MTSGSAHRLRWGISPATVALTLAALIFLSLSWREPLPPSTFGTRGFGRGFDPAGASGGTGLQGMADRLAAIDGELRIESELGRGTRVSGTIPVTPALGDGEVPR